MRRANPVGSIDEIAVRLETAIALKSVRLCFVRHAQARSADGGYDERTPLSALGERQAIGAAEAVRQRWKPAALYTSPHLRCVGTAEPLRRALGLDLRVDDRLREFEFDTLTLSEALARPDLEIWDSLHRGARNGETLGEFSRRVSSSLNEITASHLGEDVVLVTHSGVIDAAIRWCVGLSSESPWIHDFPLSNASITEVEFWPNGRVQGGAPRYSAFLRIADCSHIGDCVSDM